MKSAGAGCPGMAARYSPCASSERTAVATDSGETGWACVGLGSPPTMSQVGPHLGSASSRASSGKTHVLSASRHASRVERPAAR